MTTNMVDFDVNPFLKISQNHTILSQFLYECVSDLTEKSEIKYDNYNSDIEWTLDDFQNARKSIQNFYRKNILNEEKLYIQGLNKNTMKIIDDIFQINKEEIYQAMLKQHMLKTGSSLAEAIDWKLKWLLGCSQLATIREPILQIDLNCVKMNKETRKNEKFIVNFEGNIEQIDKLIEELSNVQKAPNS